MFLIVAAHSGADDSEAKALCLSVFCVCANSRICACINDANIKKKRQEVIDSVRHSGK